MIFWTLQRCKNGYNWAASWQNQQSECAASEDSDQPGHPPSLIRVFVVCMKKALVFSYPLSTQWRLWSDWVDAQADLSLRLVHMPFCWFCHEAAQMYRKIPKNSDTRNIWCNHPKIQTRWLYCREMHPKDADGMANGVDPDQNQTPPLEAVWSGSTLFAQTCLSENLGTLRYIKRYIFKIYYSNFAKHHNFNKSTCHYFSDMVHVCWLYMF